MISDSQMMRLLAKEAKLLEAYRFRGCLPDARPATDKNIHRYLAELTHGYATGTAPESQTREAIATFLTHFEAANPRAEITAAIANAKAMPLDAQLRLCRALADRLPLEDCLLTAAANRAAMEKPMGMATLLQSFEKAVGENAFDHWLPSQHSLTILCDLLDRDVNGSLMERLKIKEQFWNKRNKPMTGEQPFLNIETRASLDKGKYVRKRTVDRAPTLVRTKDGNGDLHSFIYNVADDAFHRLPTHELEGSVAVDAYPAHEELIRQTRDLQTNALLLTVYEPTLPKGTRLGVYFYAPETKEVFVFLCQNGFSTPLTRRMGEQCFEPGLMSHATIYHGERQIRDIELNYRSNFADMDTLFPIPIFIGSMHDDNRTENANYLKLLEASYDNPVIVLNHPSTEMLKDFVAHFKNAFADERLPPDIHMHVNGHHNHSGYFVFGDKHNSTVMHDKEIARLFNQLATSEQPTRDNVLLLNGCGMVHKNLPYVKGTVILVGGPDEFTISHARNNEYKRSRMLPPGHELVPSLGQYSDLASIMTQAQNSHSIAQSRDRNRRLTTRRKETFGPLVLTKEGLTQKKLEHVSTPVGISIHSDVKRLRNDRDLMLDKWLGTIENSLYLQSQNDPTQWATVIAPADIEVMPEHPIPPFVVELAQLQGNEQRKELLKKLEQYGCKVFDIPDSKAKSVS